MAAAARHASKEGKMDYGTGWARVLVLDDDEASRHIITEAFATQGYEVWAEPDGRAIEELFARFAPDLVILEVHFASGPSGYTLARRLRQKGDVPVVFVSSANSPEARLAAFEAGADDYVAKPLPVPELLARVAAVLRRSRRRSSGDVEIGELKMTEELAPLVSVAGKVVALTQMEYEVLEVLVRHRGKVMSKSQLIEEVWGPQPLSPELENVLAVHVSRIRRKLGNHGSLIHTVRNSGFVFAV